MTAYKGKHPRPRKTLEELYPGYEPGLPYRGTKRKNNVPYYLRKPKVYTDGKSIAPIKAQIPYFRRETMEQGDSNCPVTPPTRGMILVGTSSVVGSANPHWKRDVARGFEAGTPYSVKLYFVDSKAAETHHFANSYYCSSVFKPRRTSTLTTNPASPGFLNKYTDTQTDNIAIAKLRNFVNKSDAHTNALVPLVELRDLGHTIHGIADLTIFMLSGVQKAMKVIRRPGEAVKIASDAWLTWSFGVKPMMSDAANIAESIAAALTPDKRETNSSKQTKVSIDRTIDLSRDYGWSTSVELIKSHYIELEYRYKVGLSTIVESANDYASISEHLQLQDLGRSFVPAIYELIPYSWLVDYFTTAGDVLSDRFEAARSLRYGSKAIRYSELITFSPRLTSGSGNITSTIDDAGYLAVKHIYYNRSVFSSMPVRSLAFKTFDEIGSHGVNKVLNLLAVLGTRNKRELSRL